MATEISLPHYTTQLPGEIQVVERGYEDIHWSYDAEKPTIAPAKFFGNGEGYQFKIDPVPSYGHDLGLVRDTLRLLQGFAPLCAPVTVSVLRVHDLRNSNGWAQQAWDYYNCYTPDDCQCDVVIPNGDDETKRKRNWDGTIVLNGRTTEIHPAITRYVVPHEYAHILEDCLGLIRYPHANNDSGREVLREWAKVRGISPEQFDLKYGKLTHHLIPGEIFANDFRFMFGAETEWWPHAEVVKPLGKPGTKRAVAWWEKALEELRDSYAAATSALPTN